MQRRSGRNLTRVVSGNALRRPRCDERGNDEGAHCSTRAPNHLHAGSAYVRPRGSSSCGKAVDEPCVSCGRLLGETFFLTHRERPRTSRRARSTRFRTSLRLIDRSGCVQFEASPTRSSHSHRVAVQTSVQRFEESIGGRAYLFEVSPVEADRWRARIVKATGVPTALMPFYAATPAEAACQLRQWLLRAHERASGLHQNA